MSNVYYYNNLVNLTPSQLFYWVAIDMTLKQVGGQDVVAAAAILAGQPLIPVSGKLGGATKGTSVASVTARRLLNYQMPFRMPSITGKNARQLKIAFTKNLGAFVGRAIPGIGWMIMAYDVVQIIRNTLSKFNSLVKPEDRLW
ncbi:MAG: hypothetical protein V4545_08385 [Pseudomonadota bacterium]